MTDVIPYSSELGPKKGAFIRPDGKILFIDDNKHEEYAERYCNGRDYQILTGAKFGPPVSTERYLELKKHIDTLSQNREKYRDELDIFRTSKLDRNLLYKYKKWIECFNHANGFSYCDFLVLVLAYDKVETRVTNVITTTAAEPHVRFFNYYLMDWHIKRQDRLVYDSQSHSFHNIDHTFYSDDYYDREAEEEIKEIKSQVLLKDRPYFFK